MSYQWLWSATAVFITTMLYEYGYKVQNDKSQQPYVPGQDGTNPNWDQGKPIKQPVSQNPSDKILPQCQVWDETYQSFIHAGEPSLDESINNCFATLNTNVLPRYLDINGIPSFKVDDPLQEPDQTKWGECYFLQNGVIVSKPGEAIVNRDDRLCFAAGNGLPWEGFAFKTVGGQYSVNPNLDYTTLPNYDNTMWTLITQAPSKSANPYSGPSNNSCQEVLTVSFPNGGESATIWANTDRTTAFNGNMKGCISRTEAPSRYIQNGEILFLDKNTNETLVMPLNR